MKHTKKAKKNSDSSPFLMHYKKACQPRGRSLVECFGFECLELLLFGFRMFRNTVFLVSNIWNYWFFGSEYLELLDFWLRIFGIIGFLVFEYSE